MKRSERVRGVRPSDQPDRVLSEETGEFSDDVSEFHRMHPAEANHHPVGFKPPLEMLKRMAIMLRRLKLKLPLKDNLAPLPRE